MPRALLRLHLLLPNLPWRPPTPSLFTHSLSSLSSSAALLPRPSVSLCFRTSVDCLRCRLPQPCCRTFNCVILSCTASRNHLFPSSPLCPSGPSAEIQQKDVFPLIRSAEMKSCISAEGCISFSGNAMNPSAEAFALWHSYSPIVEAAT